MCSVFDKPLSLDKIELIGLKTELTRSQTMNFKIISSHWKIFNSSLHKIRERSSSQDDWVKYGVTYKDNGTYFYLASIPYDSQYSYPPKMIRKTIPDGFYAIFYHKGKMINLKKTVSYIFKEAIHLNNFNIVNTESSDIIYFEKYDKNFHWNYPGSIIELFVPISKIDDKEK